MKTVILAGGRGSRLAEETGTRPKPMVEIGGQPILWHILNIYVSQGFRDFLIAGGYKHEVIRDWVRRCQPVPWLIQVYDTGLETQTGGRIRALEKWIGNESFFLTYGDGLANIDLKRLLDFHRWHGKIATITAVHPPPRFGALRLDGDHVVEFREKASSEGWINGGFMVLEPDVFSYIKNDPSTIFEKKPMEWLTEDGQLMAYRHTEFWHPMDTVRDKDYLESLWQSGDIPWNTQGAL